MEIVGYELRPLPPATNPRQGYTPSEQDTRRIARSSSAMNAKVLALFHDNPNAGYIAPEVHAIVGGLHIRSQDANGLMNIR